jgi:hypothetical protein
MCTGATIGLSLGEEKEAEAHIVQRVRNVGVMSN